MGASYFKRQTTQLQSTIMSVFGANALYDIICPICQLPMEMGEKVIQFACNADHQLHTRCFN